EGRHPFGPPLALGEDRRGSSSASPRAGPDRRASPIRPGDLYYVLARAALAPCVHSVPTDYAQTAASSPPPAGRIRNSSLSRALRRRSPQSRPLTGGT